MNKDKTEKFLEKKVEDGLTVSPVLPDDKKNYLIKDGY